jgi:hypothetical protein
MSRNDIQQGVVAQSQEARPNYVRFEVVPVEDRNASIESGHYVAKDVDFAHVTTPGNTLTELVVNAEEWLRKKHVLKDPFAEMYQKSYEEWKKGNEIPEEGTPIKGWPVLSPAIQKNIINAHIRTVEDLACANDSALRSVGDHARQYQRSAQSWLDSAKDIGKTSKKIDKLEIQNEDLESQVKELMSTNNALQAQMDRIMAPVDKPRKNSKSARTQAKEKREQDPEI